MQPIQLYLDCPCTSFPRSFARDYKETYRYPPPSTLYGLLLSLVGETDMAAHLGVKLAIGIIGDDPPISRIVRKQRHHKFSKTHMGIYPTSKFSKPNHQELLTDLNVTVQIDSGEEVGTVKLAERVAIALSTPSQITRFGGLSLGESWAMVNGIRPYRETDGPVRWLVKDNRGLISLPIWIDRKTGQGTFQRFDWSDEFQPDCFTKIPALLKAASKPQKSGQAGKTS
ncbi:MAG: CRISPR-associated protein Cas5 [Kaiparowitsia implicata GSE-PSE-MK54-09C]|jgi:CRISPR-associated protein Cas5t|nr:CRISPR-associated protein Cas5 [Kaiparowitsia implicata GSE-PSE-MK54-09C]